MNDPVIITAVFASVGGVIVILALLAVTFSSDKPPIMTDNQPRPPAQEEIDAYQAVRQPGLTEADRSWLFANIGLCAPPDGWRTAPESRKRMMRKWNE